MKPHPILLSCVAALLALLGGCKKADTTVQTDTPTNRAPAPSPKVAAAPPETAPAAPAADQGAVELKVKWPVGARYVYRMDLEQRSTNQMPMLPKPMEQNVTMAMTYAVSVPKELPDNKREIEMEFLANEMEMKMGDQVMMSFDSKEAVGADAQNPFSAPFRKMIGSKIHLQVDSTGKVEKVVDLEEWYKQMGGDTPDQAKGMLAQQFNDGFFRQVIDFAHALPDKPVRPGDTWPLQVEVPAGPLGKIKVDSKITFTGWENRQDHRCARLAAVGTFQATDGIQAGPMGKLVIDNGKMTGVSFFDPELGTMVESVSDQTMRLTGNLPGATPDAKSPGKLTILLGQKVSGSLVDKGPAK